jgi:hypothetical protein
MPLSTTAVRDYALDRRLQQIEQRLRALEKQP